MENHNAENIVNEIQSLIKALKDCGGWVKRGNGEGWFNHEILADSLALINLQEQRIKELTEENERLKLRVLEENHLRKQSEEMLALGMSEVKADTVRKLQSSLYEEFLKVASCQESDEPNMRSQEVFAILERKSKELLEKNNANTSNKLKDIITEEV